MRTLRVAFGLLTSLPIRLPDDWRAGESGRAAGWYALVGLAVGALTWLAWRGASLVFPPLVAAALTLLIWVALTGGLHLDGLADCCDGLFAAAPPERRLEIMQDPRLGAFGGIGLGLVLLLKFAALASLKSETGVGILLAATLARWCVLPAALFPLARPEGMAADFVSGLRRRSILSSALLPLVLVFVLGTRGLFALLAGLAAALVVLVFTRSRIGGVTGDVFGMIVEVTETVVLLVFSVGVP